MWPQVLMPDDPPGLHLLPRPHSYARVLVRRVDTAPIKPVVATMEIDAEVWLVLEEGCYVGPPHATVTDARFVFWDEIVHSTIPPSDLP